MNSCMINKCMKPQTMHIHVYVIFINTKELIGKEGNIKAYLWVQKFTINIKRIVFRTLVIVTYTPNETKGEDFVIGSLELESITSTKLKVSISYIKTMFFK